MLGGEAGQVRRMDGEEGGMAAGAESPRAGCTFPVRDNDKILSWKFRGSIRVKPNSGETWPQALLDCLESTILGLVCLR